jgi:hypothetical protein
VALKVSLLRCMGADESHTEQRPSLARFIRSRILSKGGLPDALIIGAQKAGTTSLFEYLAQHPRVAAARRKEIHFFDNSFARGEAWYRRRFPPARQGQLMLEATPYYLFHPLAAARAFRVLPSVKVIAILREPVARAFSHYQHEFQKGRETLSFEDAIAAEPLRLGDSEEQLARGEVLSSFEHQHFSYVSRGLYAVQLERWLAHFPRQQVLAIKAEGMFESPQNTVEQVCDFLGLERIELADPAPRHQRSYPALANDSRDKLARIYQNPNQRLAELTGIHWE